MGNSVCPLCFYLVDSQALGATALKDPSLMSLIRRWYKDERIRRKIGALNGDGFAVMLFPHTGREELLTVSKFITWVSGEIQCAFIATH